MESILALITSGVAIIGLIATIINATINKRKYTSEVNKISLDTARQDGARIRELEDMHRSLDAAHEKIRHLDSRLNDHKLETSNAITKIETNTQHILAAIERMSSELKDHTTTEMRR